MFWKIIIFLLVSIRDIDNMYLYVSGLYGSILNVYICIKIKGKNNEIKLASKIFP